MINCYKYHGREDLLPAFSEDEDKNNANNQTKEKVKSRAGGHTSINVTNAASTSVDVSTLTADALTAQGVNVGLRNSPIEVAKAFGNFFATRRTIESKFKRFEFLNLPPCFNKFARQKKSCFSNQFFQFQCIAD